MPKTKIVNFLSIFLLILSACNYVAPTAQPTFPSETVPVTVIVEPTSAIQNNLPRDEAAVPRIPLEQALTALNGGAAVIVDVRSEQAYQVSHIAGAISIPLAAIERDPTSLNLEKDQWIITYCT